MSDQIVSPFQMREWKVQAFSYQCPALVMGKPDPDAPIEWKLSFHKESAYHDDEKFFAGVFSIRFSAEIPSQPSDRGQKYVFSGIVFTVSTLSAEKETADSSARMDRLLSINAGAYTVGALRSFLIQQSSMLAGRCVIFPSLNLNETKFDTEYAFQHP